MFVATGLSGCEPNTQHSTVPEKVGHQAEAQASERNSQSPIQLVQERVAQALAQPVSLADVTFREDGEWAFVSAVPTTANGGETDILSTSCSADYQDGFYDNWVCALAQRKPEGWVLIAYELGATDAPFVDWPEKYGAPASIIWDEENNRD